MEKFVINIGRQLGSGGRAIGHILAKDFGIAYYDKEILALAAKESGFCKEVFERNDEHKGFFRSVLGNIWPVLGRCADYVLRDFPRCVNVFVAADVEDRLERICRAQGVDEKTARRIMEQGDSQRADFYNFYSPGLWGAADTYHLCINSSVLGIEGTATFIKEFVKKKLGVRVGA